MISKFSCRCNAKCTSPQTGAFRVAAFRPVYSAELGARGDGVVHHDELDGLLAVLLVDGGGKVDVRLVDVGRTVGDSWQVLSGLKPGDRVIVEGGQNVRPGMSVKIRGEG